MIFTLPNKEPFDVFHNFLLQHFLHASKLVRLTKAPNSYNYFQDINTELTVGYTV